MTAFNPQPGDWVKVTAKVMSRPIPEEVEVELFSKSTQYTELVRVDLCERTDKPIPTEPNEGSVGLLKVTPGPVAFQRLGDGHWYSAGEVGRSDGLTWVELNRLGDVEVIHHG